MSFRMLGGQGQLECDIYDASGGLIGLIGFYTNDGGDGIPYSLAYGDDEESLTKNKHILSSMQFGNDDIPPHNYGGKYPKKRVVLRIYDANVQSDENEKLSIIQSPEANKKSIRKKNNATTTTLLTSSTQSATITNKTDDFVFKNCQKADRHGSWGSYPSPSDATLSGEHFTFTMNPKGNGIQGLINCEIHFQMPTKNTTTYQVARLVVEINNGGTVIGMFPYVNDPDVSDKLIKANYKYTLYAKNVGNYSFDIFQ